MAKNWSFYIFETTVRIYMFFCLSASPAEAYMDLRLSVSQSVFHTLYLENRALDFDDFRTKMLMRLNKCSKRTFEKNLLFNFCEEIS